MMKPLLIVLALMTVTAWAQTALAPPQIGFIRDSTGSLRPVYGIAGNFVLGNSTLANVDDAAFSGTFGILKDPSTLTVVDRQGQVVGNQYAPAGPALFAFSASGAPALVYLPDASVLLQWSNGVFQQVPFVPSTTVVSIASVGAGQAALILQGDDGLWDLRLRLSTGEVLSQTALVGTTATAFMFATGDLIYGDANGIVVRKPDGSEKHIDAQLPATFRFQQMGEGWIQVSDLATGQQYAIRLTAGLEQFYVLPGTDQ
jgi:hypothetical protein